MNRFATLFLVSSLLWLGAGQAQAKKDLLMAPRLNVGLRLGFGGAFIYRVKHFEYSVDPKLSYGTFARFEMPLARIISVGANFAYSLTRQRVTGDGRNLPFNQNFDLGALVKVRHSFKIGRTGAKRLMEIYLIAEGGPTFVNFSHRQPLIQDDAAFGAHVSLLPGIQVFLAKRVGILGEIGWFYTTTKAHEPGSDVRVDLTQPILQTALVIAL